MEQTTELQPAGYLRRILAQLIDTILLWPFFKIVFTSSKANYACSQVLYAAIMFSYFFFMYSRYGQTAGKMIVGIKVVQLDGSDIGVKITFKRKLIDWCIELARLGLVFCALASLTEEQFQLIPLDERSYSIYKTFSPLKLIMSLGGLWAFIDAVTILFNEHQRAIHDYIAGTRVVKVQSGFFKKNRRPN